MINEMELILSSVKKINNTKRSLGILPINKLRQLQK